MNAERAGMMGGGGMMGTPRGLMDERYSGGAGAAMEMGMRMGDGMGLGMGMGMGMGMRNMGGRGMYDDPLGHQGGMGLGYDDYGSGLTAEMRMKMGLGMDVYTRPSVALANKLLSQNRKRKDQGIYNACTWLRGYTSARSLFSARTLYAPPSPRAGHKLTRAPAPAHAHTLELTYALVLAHLHSSLFLSLVLSLLQARANSRPGDGRLASTRGSSLV